MTHLLENLVHTSHPIFAVRYSTPYIPSVALELRQRLSSSPNASCGQPFKKTAILGPELAIPASAPRFLATLSLHLATSPLTCPLSKHPLRPSRSSTITDRISILPHCSGPLHALAGRLPYSRHHSRGSDNRPTLRLDITFRLSTDHHNRPRTPARVTAVLQPGETVWYPPLKDNPPPSCRQWRHGMAAPHTESRYHMPCG